MNIKDFMNTVFEYCFNCLKNPRIIFYLFLMLFLLMFSKVVVFIGTIFLIIFDMYNSFLYDTLKQWLTIGKSIIETFSSHKDMEELKNNTDVNNVSSPVQSSDFVDREDSNDQMYEPSSRFIKSYEEAKKEQVEGKLKASSDINDLKNMLNED